MAGMSAAVNTPSTPGALAAGFIPVFSSYYFKDEDGKKEAVEGEVVEDKGEDDGGK